MIALSVVLTYLKYFGRVLWKPFAYGLMFLRSKRIYRLTLVVLTFPNTVANIIQGAVNLDLNQMVWQSLLSLSQNIGATLHKASLSFDLFLGQKTVEQVVSTSVFQGYPDFAVTVLSANKGLLIVYLLVSAFTTFLLYEYGSNALVQFLSSTDISISHRVFAYPLLLALILVYSFRNGLGLGYLQGIWSDFIRSLSLASEALKSGQPVVNESLANNSTTQIQ